MREIDAKITSLLFLLLVTLRDFSAGK